MGVVRFRIALAVLAATMSVTPAAAQSAASATTARELLSSFFVTRLSPQEETAEKFAERRSLFVNAIGDGIANAIATTPLGGSSAGFTYVIDRATGERTLRTDSFGPLFLDRPATTGAGQLNVGFNFNRLSFDEFQGVDLRDRGLLIFDNRVVFTRDNYEQYIEEYVTLRPEASIFTIYGTYGLTDRIDVGVTIPFADLSLAGQRHWDYDLAKSYANSASVRAQFPGGPRGTDFVQDTGGVSATGLGDITIRGKVAIGPSGQAAAIIGSVRLPSGDREQLLGTGEVAGQIRVVASTQIGERASVYGNGGYGFGGLSDEIGYGAGLDVVMLPRKQLTVLFELLGQNIRDSVNDIASDLLGPRNVVDTAFTPAEPQIYRTNRPYFAPGSVNLLRAAVGGKLRLGGSALLSGGVLFPLNNEGLHESARAFVGLDFTLSTRR